MQLSLQVRRLGETDAATYYMLRSRSVDRLSQPVEPEVRRELDARSCGMAARLAGYEAEGSHVWGAFFGETLIGTVALSRRSHATRGGFGVLWGMFVLPRYRGTPASRLLMDALLDDCARDGGFRQLIAPCVRDNVAGLRFLARFGFEPALWVPRHVIGEQTPDFLYLRREL